MYSHSRVKYVSGSFVEGRVKPFVAVDEMAGIEMNSVFGVFHEVADGIEYGAACLSYRNGFIPVLYHREIRKIQLFENSVHLSGKLLASGNGYTCTGDVGSPHTKAKIYVIADL